MTRTEYKGFTITETNGRFVVTPGSVANGFKAEGYATLGGAKGVITKFANMHGATEGKANDDGSVSLYVKDKDGTEGILIVGAPTTTPPEFNPKGVVPIPAADGPQSHPEGVAVALAISAKRSEDAESAARIDGMVEALEAAPLQFTTKKDDKGFPIHSDPRMAKIFAEMVYLGMVKQRDTRSRNKREGRYAGKINGASARWYSHVNNRHCESFTTTDSARTRKQRKAAKIIAKAFAAGTKKAAQYARIA